MYSSKICNFATISCSTWLLSQSIDQISVPNCFPLHLLASAPKGHTSHPALSLADFLARSPCCFFVGNILSPC